MRQMSRILTAMLLVVFVASCARAYRTPPRNLDNACSILAQRDKYARAFRKAERKWGVPINVQMAVIHQESRFRSRAKTPRRYALGVIPLGRKSSAFGYGQVIDSTWAQYKRETGRKWARRDRMADVADFMGWYMTTSYRRNGIALDDARNQYLAYHEGQAGYARGSYRNKAWLLRVADRVQARSDMYRRQLQSCGRI